MNACKSLSVFLLAAPGLLSFSSAARADGKESNPFQLQRDIATLQRQVQVLQQQVAAIPTPSPTDVYLSFTDRVVLTPVSGGTPISTLDLPAGNYVVSAQVYFAYDPNNIYTPVNGLTGLDCSVRNSLAKFLVASSSVGGTEVVDFLSSLSLGGVTGLVVPGQISLICSFTALPNTQTTSVELFQVRLVAQAVGEIHDQSPPQNGPRL
jgi:hypothetical protein